MSSWRSLARKFERTLRRGKRIVKHVRRVQIAGNSEIRKYRKYFDDPVGFARDILKIELVPKQQELLLCLRKPPYYVLAPSGNELGKSLAAAVGVLWWHCTRSPSIIVTTAPTARQVRDILWKEIRRIARAAKLKLHFLPKACRIERAEDDFAVGITASYEQTFKGTHGPHLFFAIDESSGVSEDIFSAIETMFDSSGRHAMLCTFNCDKTGTHIHNEMMRADRPQKEGGKYCHIVRMNGMEHPNITAELKGAAPPVPFALRLGKLESVLKKHSQLVGCELDDPQGLHRSTDVIWPPTWATEYCERTQQKPRWWRPGPKAEVVILGRYPSQGSNAVWSEGDWYAATREGEGPLPLPLEPAQIGVDVAEMPGGDFTAIHVRIGPCSVHHEERQGQSTPITFERLKYLTKHYADFYMLERSKLPEGVRHNYAKITDKDIKIKIDCDGLGGVFASFVAVEGYSVVRIGAGTKAIESKDYPNRRSELWFTTAEKARDEEVDLWRLNHRVLEDGTVVIDKEGDEIVERMRRQFCSVTYSIDSRGRRVVMKKEELRKLIGCSPDAADAVNLCHAQESIEKVDGGVPAIIRPRQHPLSGRRGGR